MRLRAILFAATGLGSAAFLAWKLAGAAALYVERNTGDQVAEALRAAGQDWAEVATDGLIVTLSGAAPNETSRFRAMELARQVVANDRIVDATTQRRADPLTPPPFAIEILRNGSEVSLIGLVPDGDARARIDAALASAGIDGPVTDMLETTAYAAPVGWPESLGFGLNLLSALPRAKIAVQPGWIEVAAVTESEAAREELQNRLRAAVPNGVELVLDISAPRPVIAPFTVEFLLEKGAGRFVSCSAETEAAMTEIIAAARATGLAGEEHCALGLGAPSPEWPTAVANGLSALRDLGGGRLAMRDTEVVLTGPDGIPPEQLNEIGDSLAAKLPDIFSLTAIAPPRMEVRADGGRVYAPEFRAILASDGTVRLEGAIQDATSQAAIDSYAKALFGHDQVSNATVIDADLPDGWPGRVLVGIEALAGIKEGRLTVNAREVALDGWGITEDAGDRAAALLSSKAGPAAVEIRFDAEAAAAAAFAARPRPEICAEDISAILADGSIGFRPGSSEIDPESRGVIAAIADVLRGCPGAHFMIAGHTDSQGDGEANVRLSQARAEAVRHALVSQDLPLITFSAQGFGASQPVADNSSGIGRSRNRRIELTLVTPDMLRAAAAFGSATDVDEDPAACADDLAAILEDKSIQFAPGSSNMDPESSDTIAAIADRLSACPPATIEIAGHTDSLGRAEVNQRLSQERAEAVMAALDASELSQITLMAKGYGAERPIADNDTDEGRRRNRRIELTLLDSKAQSVGTMGAERCVRDIAAGLEENAIQFGLGSSEIDPGSEPTIAAIAEMLETCPETTFEIGGHTDDRGSAEGNRRLSQARAQAVRDALAEQGIEAARLTALGHGQDQPIADNATREGRARNRRIELTLIAPSGGVPGPHAELRLGPQ